MGKTDKILIEVTPDEEELIADKKLLQNIS